MNFLFYVMLMSVSSCFLHLGEPLSFLAIEGLEDNSFFFIDYFKIKIIENINKWTYSHFLLYVLKHWRNPRTIYKSSRQWTWKVSDSLDLDLLRQFHTFTRPSHRWLFDQDLIEIKRFKFHSMHNLIPILKFELSDLDPTTTDMLSAWIVDCNKSKFVFHMFLYQYFILDTSYFILMLVVSLICLNFCYRAIMKDA